jgi:hypothetical protein
MHQRCLIAFLRHYKYELRVCEIMGPWLSQDIAPAF